MQKNYAALECMGMCLLFEISWESCTSGLVANRNVKSMLMANLLKGTMAMPGWQVAQMWLGGLESHLMAEALKGAHAY